MTPPTPSVPLLRSIRHRAASSASAPKLSDYPDLALAATATTAGLKTSQPNASQVCRHLIALGLVSQDRGQPADLRHVHARLTEAGTKVLASIVALTALSGPRRCCSRAGHAKA